MLEFVDATCRRFWGAGRAVDCGTIIKFWKTILNVKHTKFRQREYQITRWCSFIDIVSIFNRGSYSYCVTHIRWRQCYVPRCYWSWESLWWENVKHTYYCSLKSGALLYAKRTYSYIIFHSSINAFISLTFLMMSELWTACLFCRDDWSPVVEVTGVR